MSGNGLPGGDYRAAFSVASALDLTLSSANVAENSGTTLVTVTRNDSATNAITVSLTSSDSTAITLPTTVTIPAGAFSATFVITGVNDALADGDQLARVTAVSDGYVSTSVDIKVIDDETPTFAVTVFPSSIAENGGTAQVTVSRNTPTAQPLVVALASSNVGAATLPNSVTIPAGAASATVLVSAVDDALADGDETVTLTASRAGFTSGSAPVLVVDNETATLLMTLSVASIAENGGRTMATVTRNTPTTTALTVSLSSSDSRLVSLPATITLGIGASSSSFFVTAINDSFAFGSQTVSVTASSSGFISAVSQVAIVDDDEATFTLTLNAASMSENGGRLTATVLRNTPTTFNQAVNLTSGDPTAALVPGSVSIPAGSSTVSFDVVAVNDSVADGNQLTFIVASAPGIRDGQAQVTITDDDLATLTLDVVSSSISERDGQTQVTVTRNTPPSTALQVNLSSNPAFKLSMPASVTIAAGALSTTFVVQAIDDFLASGTQSATVSASAAGFIEGSAPITLVDDDVATLQLTLGAAFVSENIRTTTGKVTRNTSANNELLVSLTSSDPAVALPSVTAVTIPAGAASVQFEIQVTDDTVADGTQLAIISATAEGYVAATATLNVMNDDVAALRMSATATRLSENGGTTVVTVARNTPVASEQLISFQSNKAGVISMPPSATIPAGAESTTIVITGIDDTLAYGDRDASLVAEAAGLSGASLRFTVTDDDVAGLSLTFVSPSLAENGGVTSGRVQRNSPTSEALVVALNPSVPGALSVPATITIPVGATFATFFVSAIDNLTAEGPRTVELNASATGLTASMGSIGIVDDDVARLTLNLASGSVPENVGSILASVRRNTTTDEEQIVQLSSNAPNKVSLPDSVTILRGAESAAFQIAIIDDLSFAGDVTAEITAAAIGFVQASSTLLIIEDETNWPWHNALNPLDVNADGFVTAIDALLVINHLNRGGISSLPDPTSGNAPPPYLDVNRDGQATAIDALLVINRLNQGVGAEGEDTSLTASTDQLFADFEWLESLLHKRTRHQTLDTLHRQGPAGRTG